jgi:hypothetical protein
MEAKLHMKVKEIILWRTAVENRPGEMSRVLEALASIDLKVALGNQGRIVDIGPIEGRKAQAAARAAGFEPLPTPAILVRGKNRPGICHSLTRVLGGAGLSMDSLIGQSTGGKYQVIIGLGSKEDAARALEAIKKAFVAKKSEKKNRK